MNKSKIQTLRNESVSNILRILKRHNGTEGDFCLGSTPIILEDPFDDNNTYTLDRLELVDNGSDFIADASNCFQNITIKSEDLFLEVLIGIEEFLQDNEKIIWNDDLL